MPRPSYPPSQPPGRQAGRHRGSRACFGKTGGWLSLVFGDVCFEESVRKVSQFDGDRTIGKCRFQLTVWGRWDNVEYRSVFFIEVGLVIRRV